MEVPGKIREKMQVTWLGFCMREKVVTKQRPIPISIVYDSSLLELFTTGVSLNLMKIPVERIVITSPANARTITKTHSGLSHSRLSIGIRSQPVLFMFGHQP